MIDLSQTPAMPVTGDLSGTEDDIRIQIKHLSKKFCRNLKRSYLYGLQDIAKEVSGLSRHSQTLRKGEFWALQDIDLTIKRGQSVGMVGVNGSGKTTLLRIISGLMRPDIGEVRIRGRVAALIALGAGFNPLLTGRENVYINMSILGLSRREIERKFQDVLDFSEIEHAIDAPVRTYSSGMKARLGFACAIHTDPDILLIDEVLAVGDFNFRTKCYQRLSDLRKNGVSFILVSHAPSAIRSNCDYAAYLSQGKLAMYGDAEEVMHRYEQDIVFQHTNQEELTSKFFAKRKNAHASIQIQSITLQDESGALLDHLVTGEPAYISVELETEASVEQVGINIIIRSLTKPHSSFLFLKSGQDTDFFSLIPGRTTIKLYLPYCGLAMDAYSMKLNVTTEGLLYRIQDIVESFKFKVMGSEGIDRCSYYQPRRWFIENEKNADRKF